MGEVSADGVADDGELGLEPADAGAEQVPLQAQEGAQRQPDVVALGPLAARLALLGLGVLLDPPVVCLYRPSVLRHLLTLEARHLEVRGGPVANVSVWGDHLEHLDQPVTLKPDLRPLRRYLRARQGPL